jgi:hypothetical protein
MAWNVQKPDRRRGRLRWSVIARLVGADQLFALSDYVLVFRHPLLRYILTIKLDLFARQKVRDGLFGIRLPLFEPLNGFVEFSHASNMPTLRQVA